MISSNLFLEPAMQSVNKPVLRHLPPTLSDADVKAQLERDTKNTVTAAELQPVQPRLPLSTLPKLPKLSRFNTAAKMCKRRLAKMAQNKSSVSGDLNRHKSKPPPCPVSTETKAALPPGPRAKVTKTGIPSISTPPILLRHGPCPPKRTPSLS